MLELGNGNYGIERWMLFCIAVAGKEAKQTHRALDLFLDKSTAYKYDVPPLGALSPFKYVRELKYRGKLLEAIQSSGFGQYNRLSRAFYEASFTGIDTLRHCEPADLERIHGVGPKTSRFFILSTRPHARYAVLDTHILAFMREELGIDTPKQTPQSKSRYAALERAFLAYCDSIQLPPGQVDYEIWASRARGRGLDSPPKKAA